jgi:acetyl-CoA carboxylase carboxyl transferase subunit beta
VADGFAEYREETIPKDPLDWPGYEAQLAHARNKSGEMEAVITGAAYIGGTRIVIIAFDFNFLGGSMGAAAGAKIVEAFARARESRQAVVSLVATGGARMQEGMRSLIQLQELADACARARVQGIPHVSVLRNPTTGGVWASLAASADFLIGVKGAAVSFAGSRLRGDEYDQEPFASSGKLKRGFIDMELEAEDVPKRLASVVALLSSVSEGLPHPPELPGALGRLEPPEEAWDSVERARSLDRPHAVAYLDAYFEERVGISGDRVGGVDESMLCGFGRRKGHTIAYAAQCGVANSAAGFRTAKRLLKLAERHRLPVLTLIDTPGARNEEKDEQEGIGTAIAELLCTVADMSVPMTSLVIGEGGSGGALALAAPGNLWITPDSYFAVIAPESAAVILEHNESQAEEVSEDMQLMPQDLVRLGIARGIITPET